MNQADWLPSSRRRLSWCGLFFGALLLAPVLAVEATERPGLRSVDPSRTVYLDLPDGRIVIELSDTFAPRHVAQFQKLVRSGFYDGKTFYRVIDGFVAQGGDGSDLEGEFPNPLIEAEFERPWSDELPWTPVDQPDLFASSTGFVDGRAAGRDPEAGRVWLTHCPGVVAMARNNGRDTASTDFYIVIGQAPRYLDRNMSIFGRVVLGMEIVQRINRGPRNADGVIEEEQERTPMVRARVAADLPEEERLELWVTDTASEEFATLLESRRNRVHEFFHFKPPPVLDVCQVPLRGQVATE